MLPIQGRDIQCIGTCLVEVMRVETGWGHGTGSSVGRFGAQVSRVDLAYTFSGQEGRFPAIGPCHRLKVNAEAKMCWAVGRAFAPPHCGPPQAHTIGCSSPCPQGPPGLIFCPATWSSCQPCWRPCLHPPEVLASGSADA